LISRDWNIHPPGPFCRAISHGKVSTWTFTSGWPVPLRRGRAADDDKRLPDFRQPRRQGKTNMTSEFPHLPEGVRRVAAALREAGHPHAPIMLDDACHTAQQAADALGVQLGQIAKSIIFRRKSDDAAVLVITSGDQRVDEKKVDALIGKTGRADAGFVKAKTGFSIGGVSPFAHASAPVTLIDRKLFRYPLIWAAAGHPRGLVQLTPQDIERLTGAPVADVT
jgi:prolyl-tRNA editing enzyme YbaK/EbsC (Cys-tRNA(Pro) deacylase)